jgi:hypothetical protein
LSKACPEQWTIDQIVSNWQETYGLHVKLLESLPKGVPRLWDLGRQQENAVILSSPTRGGEFRRKMTSFGFIYSIGVIRLVIGSGVWPVFGPNGVEGPAFGPLKDATKL